MTASPLAVARACLQAYIDKDRTAIGGLIADEYHLTSPIDNALDRKTYFEVCWPNSKAITGFDYVYQIEDGKRAFIVYEGRIGNGKTFRNCEVHTVRNAPSSAQSRKLTWNDQPTGTGVRQLLIARGLGQEVTFRI
jgi:hypothetical protein